MRRGRASGTTRSPGATPPRTGCRSTPTIWKATRGRSRATSSSGSRRSPDNLIEGTRRLAPSLRTLSRSRSAAHEQDEPREQDQREDQLTEAALVHTLEQEGTRDGAGDRGQREPHGEAPHRARERPGPPVAGEDRPLVHDEEGLQVRFDGARAPALSRRVENHWRAWQADRAPRDTGPGPRARPPPAPPQLLRVG